MGANASADQNESQSIDAIFANSSSSSADCNYESVDLARFMLIVALGTPCAVFGIIFNLILCVIYSRPQHLRTSDLYFAILALFDTAFCILYIFVMTIDAVSLHYGYTFLYSFYITYTFPLFAIGRIIQLASVYMVVVVTVERFFIVRRWSDAMASSCPQLLSPQKRLTIALSICAASVCLRSPSFWEYAVVEKSECTDPFGAYQFEERLAAVESYIIFNFYVMNVVQVFAPFVLLTVLNVGIIRTLRRRLSLAKKFLFPISYVSEVSFQKGLSREKLKSATYTLIALVSGYLISTLFHVGITVLEYVAKYEPTVRGLLVDEEGRSHRWYTLSSDITSVLTIANSCLRLPLYCLCSRALRRELFKFRAFHPVKREPAKKEAQEKAPLHNSVQFCEAS